MSLRPGKHPDSSHHPVPIPLSPRDITRSGLCIGCGSCVAQAHVSPVSNELRAAPVRPSIPDPSQTWDKREPHTERLPTDAGAQMALNAYGQLKAAGSPAWMRRRSVAFARTCPFSPSARNEDDLAATLFPMPHTRTPAWDGLNRRTWAMSRRKAFGRREVQAAWSAGCWRN